MFVALVLFGSSSSYTLKANFQDAGGLVTGNVVLLGPMRVGSVKSIDLTADGQAQVVMGIDPSVGEVPQGTVARIHENSLSGSPTSMWSSRLEQVPSGFPTAA